MLKGLKNVYNIKMIKIESKEQGRAYICNKKWSKE